MMKNFILRNKDELYFGRRKIATLSDSEKLKIFGYKYYLMVDKINKLNGLNKYILLINQKRVFDVLGKRIGKEKIKWALKHIGGLNDNS